MMKRAYSAGADDANAQYGVAPDQQERRPLLAEHLPQQAPPPEKKSPSWLPALGVGGLAALGAYHGMRVPRFSSNPATKAMQTFGAEQGLHRVIDVSKRRPVPASAHWMDRLMDKTYPQVERPGADLNMMNKLKLFLHEGPSAIPIAEGKGGQRYIPGKPQGVDTNGWVFNRDTYGKDNLIRGGKDLEGNARTQQLFKEMESKGKNYESNLLSHYAPDMTPKTFTAVGSVFHPTGDDRYSAANQLQQSIHQHMGGNGVNDYMLKPAFGFQSSGRFPKAGEDWAGHLAKYDRFFQNPKNSAKYQALLGPNGELTAKNVALLKSNSIHEGHVVNEALKDPSRVQAQERIPNGTGEFRVHAAQGAISPGLTMPRSLNNKTEQQLMLSGDELNHLHSRVQSVLDRLPPEYRHGAYGFDVMRYTHPQTGLPDFRVVEMNQHANPTDSGFLDSLVGPGVGHQHHVSVTGRHTVPVAAGVAGAMGLGGLAATRLYQHATQDGDDEAHPVG